MTRHEFDAILPMLAQKADIAELRREIQTRAVQVIVIAVSVSLMATVVCVAVFR
jgi:ribosomal protein S12 methylthiotransferase accessory factor YcaO